MLSSPSTVCSEPEVYFTVDHYSDHEHVLTNPDMYIGSVNADTAVLPVVTSTESWRVTMEPVQYIPALFKMVDEMLVNCRDHVVRMADLVARGVPNSVPVTHIHVTFDPATGEIATTNDGNALDVVKVADEVEHVELYVPELTFTRLRSSSNFARRKEGGGSIIGGKHGIGAKVVVIWSSQVTISLFDHVRQLQYTQVIRNNRRSIGAPEIQSRPRLKQPFTTVRFVPDYARLFGTPTQGWQAGTPFALGFEQLLRRRVADIAAVTHVAVKYNGEKVPVRSFAHYVSLYLEPEAVRLQDATLGERWDVCVARSPAGRFCHVSFVNGVHTSRGGKHVAHVMDQLVDKLRAMCAAKTKTPVSADLVRDQMMLFLRCDVEDPDFEGQIKDTMTTPASKFGSKCVIGDAFVKRVADKLRIVEHACAAAEQRATRSVAPGVRRATSVQVEKLSDANLAGTARSSECVLLLVEGDSAKSSVLSGLSAADRDIYGVLPIGGKIINARDATRAMLVANKDVGALMTALHLEFDKSYTPESAAALLRYGRVQLVTDQDYDGFHIRGLLLNLFESQWPSLLLCVRRFMSYMNTPIIKARHRCWTRAAAAAAHSSSSSSSSAVVPTKGKKRGRAGAAGGAAVAAAAAPPTGAGEEWFFTVRAFERWWAGVAEKERDKWTVKYYKGLGTSDASEFKMYFQCCSPRYYTADDELSRDALDMAFRKKRADDRKLWIGRPPGEEVVEGEADCVPIHRFVNTELVMYSRYSCERMIASVMDGQKTGQRKILFSAFRKHLTTELKVTQFSGYVAEHTVYAHGGTCLDNTIIGMAQDFMGSNNFPLLQPRGQFGTRHLLGKDAASARYIYTCLAPETRLLFPVADDAVLAYRNEEGLSVEPVHYVPVLPVLLLNGDAGIGTGFSSSVPPFSPRDLLRALRLLLAGGEADLAAFHAMSFVPWFRGFRGRVAQEAPARFRCEGIWERSGPAEITVTELPPGKGTAAYKAWLDAACAEHLAEQRRVKRATPAAAAEPEAEPEKKKKKQEDRPPLQIIAVHENNTDVTVCVRVVFASPDAVPADPVAALQLCEPVFTSNMYAYRDDETLIKYETVQQIILDYFPVRMRVYEQRKAHLVQTLDRQLEVLRNKARFVGEIVQGQLEMRNVPLAEVRRALAERGYAPGDDPAAPFDYLTGMRLHAITTEKYGALLQQTRDKEVEREQLVATSPADMWEHDLRRFEQETR